MSRAESKIPGHLIGRSIFDLPDALLASIELVASGLEDGDESHERDMEETSAGVRMGLGVVAKEAGSEAPASAVEGAEKVQEMTAKTAPGIVFTSREELAEHNRSDWHRFNLKRLACGGEVVSSEAFLAMVEGDGSDISSISGSESSRGSSDDGDDDAYDDEEELRELLAAQSDMRLRERAAGAGAEDEEEQGASVAEGHLLRVAAEGARGGEDAAVYRALLERRNEHGAGRRDAGAMLLALKSATTTCILAGGGHFAAAVFQGRVCVAHKTLHRYVIRAKAGQRQAAKDASGGKTIKSAGSSLRRHNEAALQRDIEALLVSWKAHLAESERVVVHAPGIINRQSVFVPGVLDRADPRVRPPPRPGLPFPAPLL